MNIHQAVEINDIERVKKLLKHKDLKNHQNHTPLHIASQYNHIAIAKLLIENGADVNIKSDTGWTLLHIASQFNMEIAELLIKYGADINANDNIGWTSLHLASQTNNIKIAELLIKNGADVNAKNYNRNTPLYFAFIFDYLEFAELLIKNGADVHLKCDAINTPFDIICKRKYTDLLSGVLRYIKYIPAINKNWSPCINQLLISPRACMSLRFLALEKISKKANLEKLPLHLKTEILNKY